MEPFRRRGRRSRGRASQDSASLEVEIDKLQARLVRRPKRAEVPVTREVQLVVEYYAAR
jgi:ribosomal protein S4